MIPTLQLAPRANIDVVGVTPTVPDWANVVLLVHGNGANAGTVFIDNSLLNRNGLGVGNVQTSTARSKFNGSSLLFDGTGDQLNMDGGCGLGAEDFTIEAWCYPTSFATNMTIAASWLGSGAGKRNWNLLVAQTTGYPTFLVTTDGSTSTSPGPGFTGPALTLNAWNHVVAMRVGSTFYWCVNGVVSSTAMASTLYAATGSSGMVIGANQDGGGASTWFWNGNLAEIRVVLGQGLYPTTNFTPPTSALPNPVYVSPGADPHTASVKALIRFNGTSATDDTGKTITQGGNATTSATQSKFGGKAGYVDGSGDYFLIPKGSGDFAFGSQFTIEFWVRYNAAPQAFGRLFMSREGDFAGPVQMFIDTGTSNFQLHVTVSVNGTSDAFTFNAGLIGQCLTSGLWQHVRFVRDGTIVYLYVDGSLRMSGNIGSSAALSSNTAHNMAIGGQQSSSSRSTNSYFDDFRFTEGVARTTRPFALPPQEELAL
jgi:hypothetical protein